MLKSFWVIKKKKKSWEMWRKALSNYSVYLGSTWWNIYITTMEVLKVIKLAGRVSSLFPLFFSPDLFKREETEMWTKPPSPVMRLPGGPRHSRPPLTGRAVLSSSLNATANPLNPNGWESEAGCDSSAVRNFPLSHWGFCPQDVKLIYSAGGTK